LKLCSIAGYASPCQVSSSITFAVELLREAAMRDQHSRPLGSGAIQEAMSSDTPTAKPGREPPNHATFFIRGASCASIAIRLHLAGKRFHALELWLGRMKED
jgi:hypothetical protein